MAEDSIRDLVRQVRSTLRRKGSLGTFLLSELDASISQGIEEVSLGDQAERAAPRQIIGRRMPDEDELLEILISVLRTYLLTLPEAADSLATHLREQHKIEHIEIALDPSLLDEELQRTGLVRLDAIVPGVLNVKASDALRQLCELVAKRSSANR
jgi:hypothetical protein